MPSDLWSCPLGQMYRVFFFLGLVSRPVLPLYDLLEGGWLCGLLQVCS